MAVGYNNYKIKAHKKLNASDSIADSGFTIRFINGSTAVAKSLSLAIKAVGDSRARIIRNRDGVVVWKK